MTSSFVHDALNWAIGNPLPWEAEEAFCVKMNVPEKADLVLN